MIWGFHFRKPLYADVLPRPAHFSRKALFFPWFFSTFFSHAWAGSRFSWWIFNLGWSPKGLDRGQDLDARAAGGPSGNLWNFHGNHQTNSPVMEFWMRRCAKIIEFLMCVSCPRTQLLPIHPTVSVRGCFAGIRPSRRISQDPVRFFCMAWWLFHSVFWVC